MAAALLFLFTYDDYFLLGGGGGGGSSHQSSRHRPWLRMCSTHCGRLLRHRYRALCLWLRRCCFHSPLRIISVVGRRRRRLLHQCRLLRMCSAAPRVRLLRPVVCTHIAAASCRSAILYECSTGTPCTATPHVLHRGTKEMMHAAV